MRALAVIQILPLSHSKPLFSNAKAENEKGGLCVTRAHLNFINTQMCICSPRQSSETDPGGWGWGFLGPHLGACRDHTWDLWGSYPGSQDVRALCSGCFISPLALYLQCCRMCSSAHVCLFPDCFSLFSDCFFTFLPPPVLFSRIPASFALSFCTVLLF